MSVVNLSYQLFSLAQIALDRFYQFMTTFEIRNWYDKGSRQDFPLQASLKLIGYCVLLFVVVVVVVVVCCCCVLLCVVVVYCSRFFCVVTVCCCYVFLLCNITVSCYCVLLLCIVKCFLLLFIVTVFCYYVLLLCVVTMCCNCVLLLCFINNNIQYLVILIGVSKRLIWLHRRIAFRYCRRDPKNHSLFYTMSNVQLIRQAGKPIPVSTQNFSTYLNSAPKIG